MSWIKTIAFWNSRENITYFSKKPADPRIEKRLKAFAKEKQSAQLRALDLGCGGGRHTELLVSLGFETSIFDLNIQMLRASTARVGRDRLESVKRGSIVHLPYKNESFDIVVTTGVLHQAKKFSEYEKAVSELSRVLKTGGLVCLNIFSSKALDDTYTKLPETFVYQTKEGLDMSLLSKETFYELMAWHGLVLEEELSEDVVEENTGKRSVLRCNFTKVK